MQDSKASEVMAHFVEAQVWRELGGAKTIQNLDLSKLSKFQREVLASQATASKIQTTNDMLEYINSIHKYRALPEYYTA
jgi:hypothetical protein